MIVGQREQPDSLIALCVSLHHGRRVITRAVVDHDRLPIGEGLGNDRLERGADVGRTVVGRHDDRHQWGRRHGDIQPGMLV